MSPARLVCLALCILPACKKDDAKPAPAAHAAEGAAVVTVDGSAAGSIDPGKAATYPPLGALLPAGKQDLQTWTSIEIKTSDGKTQTIDSPAKDHPGQVAAFFPSGSGVGFGFFEPGALAKKQAPAWKVEGVISVAIKSGSGAGTGAGTGTAAGQGGQGGGNGEGGGAENSGDRPKPTADLTITIASAAGEVTFTGDKLAALPTTHAPVGDTDTPGWTLDQVLAAAGVKPTDTVVVDGSEGANLVLGKDDFDPEKAILFIKLNRSGALRFRVFRKSGSTWEVGGELRGITRIEMK